ncbi:MAG: OFA family MFS transporter [Candidatus Thermoplasmatota archaeon]|nr:OFA family MFS transporter [Candidatus Thermoplasmatota archaeon]
MAGGVPNRWLIVVGAIMIQLALGSIYAWSVFTPPLSNPLPDEDFINVDSAGVMTVELEGDLVVGAESEIEIKLLRNGEPVNDVPLIVDLALRNSENEPVKDDKIVPYLGITYHKGDPIVMEDVPVEIDGDHYVISPKVTKGGSWHFIIKMDGAENETFEVLQNVRTGEFGFTITQTQIIFAVGLLTFAVFTIIGGRISARIGPRNMAIIGGVVLGSGYIIGSFLGNSFIGLTIAIGLMGGAGIGLGYVVPIAVGVKWFPDKKGLISGLAVAGFGFGALIWVKLCTGFIFGPLKLTGDWGGLYETMSVSNVFLLYGIMFMVIVVLGGLIMRNPPDGWKPAGWNPPEPTSKKASGSNEFTPSQMKRTPQYYMLFYMFMVGAGAGLMVIGVIQLFAKYALTENGYAAAEAVTIASTAFALFYSLSNGFGRIIWGALSDKLGRKLSFALMFGSQGVVMIAFFFVGGSEYLLYLAAALIGFNFGGNFALFPSATADFFGNKTVGLNYGWVFLSYGFGGILGPILGGVMGDMELWAWAFIPAGIACFSAAVLALLLKAPEPKG